MNNLVNYSIEIKNLKLQINYWLFPLNVCSSHSDPSNLLFLQVTLLRIIGAGPGLRGQTIARTGASDCYPSNLGAQPLMMPALCSFDTGSSRQAHNHCLHLLLTCSFSFSFADPSANLPHPVSLVKMQTAWFWHMEGLCFPYTLS